MDKTIEYIHNNKLAIPNKKYFGKDGTVYIGLANKRLKVVSEPTVTIVETVSNESSTTFDYTPEDVANKVTDFTSPDDETYPTTLAVSTALSTAGQSINKIMAYIAAY